MTKKRILVIEDSPDDVEVLERALAEQGFEPMLDVVQTAEAALGLRERGYLPDAIITDLRLPGADGHTLIEEVRKEGPWKDRRIVVLSSSDSNVDRERSSRAGANEYVLKPDRLREWAAVADAIKAAIDGSDAATAERERA